MMSLILSWILQNCSIIASASTLFFCWVSAVYWIFRLLFAPVSCHNVVRSSVWCWCCHLFSCCSTCHSAIVPFGLHLFWQYQQETVHASWYFPQQNNLIIFCLHWGLIWCQVIIIICITYGTPCDPFITETELLNFWSANPGSWCISSIFLEI